MLDGPEPTMPRLFPFFVLFVTGSRRGIDAYQH